MSSPPRPRPASRWFRWPITLTVAFTAALLASAWLLPSVYVRWQIAGLSSQDIQRREASLNWVIHHAREDPEVYERIVDRLAGLPFESAGQTYMALSRTDLPWAGDDFDVALCQAYAGAPDEAFLDLATVVIEHDRWSRPFSEALAARFTVPVSDPTFLDLVAVADEVGLWRRGNVAPDLWLRWIGLYAHDPDPALQRFALMRLLDAAEPVLQTQIGGWDIRWDHSDTTGEALSLVSGLTESNDPHIRRAALLVSQAWEAHLAEDEGAASKPTPFNTVVPDRIDHAPNTDLPEEPSLALLYRIESQRSHPDAYHSDDLPSASWPILQRILALPIGFPTTDEAMAELLAVDDPWLAALAAVMSLEREAPPALIDRAATLITDIDPVNRRAGVLLVLLARGADPMATPAAWLRPHPDAWTRLEDPHPDPDPGVAALIRLWHGVDPDRPTDFATMLQRDGLPHPQILTALLAMKHRAGWDHVLGPFGLSDDELITLLDHHRFAWVLDALMPADAPRFPLWVERDTQLEAIATLRVWYARNRARWTHG